MRKLLFLFVLFFGCKKSDITEVTTNFDNVAFIINGGDNSISVLDLSTSEIKTNIYLPNSNSFFAHHIYLSKSQNELAIAMPGYDFSNGHTGLHNVTTQTGKVFILDSKTGKIKLTVDNQGVNHNVIINDKNNEIWTNVMSHSGKIKIYNRNTGSLINEIAVGADPSELTFAKNEKLALIAPNEGSFLIVIDTDSKKIVKEIKVDPYPGNVWPGYDENTVFVENNVTQTLNIVDLDQLKVIDFIDFDFKPGNMVYNNFKEEIWICAGRINKLIVFKKNAGLWSKTQEIITGKDPHQIKFNKDFSKAFLVNQAENTIQIIDTQTYKVLKSVNTGLKPNGIVLQE